MQRLPEVHRLPQLQHTTTTLLPPQLLQNPYSVFLPPHVCPTSHGGAFVGLDMPLEACPTTYHVGLPEPCARQHPHSMVPAAAGNAPPSEAARQPTVLHPPEVDLCDKPSVLSCYRQWLQRRADLPHLLAPLSGKRLVCNCRSHSTCHGHVLIELYAEVFACEEENFDFAIIDDDDADSDDHHDYTQHTTHNPTESTISTSVSRSIDTATEWSALTESIRGLANRCFGEVFSGLAVLSTAFAQAGWPTAPPVDIAHTPMYDMLNPFFMAVVWTFC